MWLHVRTQSKLRRIVGDLRPFCENPVCHVPRLETSDSGAACSFAAAADWLMAPEGTLPLNDSLSAPAPIPLMSGGFRWSRGRQHSAMVLVEAGGTTPVASIDKHRLVPLGEWVPSWPGLSGLSAIGGLEAGEPSRLWRWGGPPAAVAICY